MKLPDGLLERVLPGPEEQAELAEAAQSLLAALRDVVRDRPVEPTLQGSVAKGTWIAGSRDMDLFLRCPPEFTEAELEAITEELAQATLDHPRAKYAQHPYRIGSYLGFDVDLVPCYRIESPQQMGSAVDRTPFHTAWVQAHLTEDQLQDVRILKRWCKGVQVYGAETAIGGFSGYLLEVLVHRCGSFQAVLEAFAAGSWPHDDQESFEASPLQIQDPVDADRNVSAAVKQEVLEQFQAAAKATLASPHMAFWFPPQRREPEIRDWSALESSWVALDLRIEHERPDLIYPQFQRSLQTLMEAAEKEGFTNLRAKSWFREPEVRWVVVADAFTPPKTLQRQGPRTDKEPNASRFLDKWQGNPDLIRAPWQQDGFWWVEVANPVQHLRDVLRLALERKQVPKHVAKATPLAWYAETLPDAEAWAFAAGKQPWESGP